MAHRLIVVGNGPQPSGKWWHRLPSASRRIAREIDSFDLVMRFNEIKNREAPWIGTRTDILFMRAEGDPARRRAQGGAINLPDNLKPKRIIFSCDEESERLFPDIVGDTARGRIFSEQILKNLGLEDLPQIVVPPAYILDLMKLLSSPTDEHPPIPSLGMQGIHYAVTAPEFAGYEIYLIGFSFKGWRGHAWTAERRLVHDWQHEGKLRYLL